MATHKKKPKRKIKQSDLSKFIKKRRIKDITSDWFDNINELQNKVRCERNGTFAIFQSSKRVTKERSLAVHTEEILQRSLVLENELKVKIVKQQCIPRESTTTIIQRVLNTIIEEIEAEFTRKERLRTGWQNRFEGQPPKSGKKRKWSCKEKNYFVKSFMAFNPPAGCRSIRKKSKSFLQQCTAVDKPSDTLLRDWTRIFKKKGP